MISRIYATPHRGKKNAICLASGLVRRQESKFTIRRENHQFLPSIENSWRFVTSRLLPHMISLSLSLVSRHVVYIVGLGRLNFSRSSNAWVLRQLAGDPRTYANLCIYETHWSLNGVCVHEIRLQLLLFISLSDLSFPFFFCRAFFRSKRN